MRSCTGDNLIRVDIISVGTLKEKYLREACAEYEKRLSAYCNLHNLSFRGNSDIIPLLSRRALKIALCVEGKEISSEEFAKELSSFAVSGGSHVQFVIGASDGLPEEVKAACDRRISFSKMTFPHQLMRVILLEQLYRAFNINSGGKYHK